LVGVRAELSGLGEAGLAVGVLATSGMRWRVVPPITTEVLFTGLAEDAEDVETAGAALETGASPLAVLGWRTSVTSGARDIDCDRRAALAWRVAVDFFAMEILSS